jgi:tetratricopeptide (TPR) repeat protein
MIKPTTLSQITNAVGAKKKTLQQWFCQKQKQLESKLDSLAAWGKQGFKKLKELPHNYRNIAAKIARPIILLSFVAIFVTNLLLPANQAEKVRQAFLTSPADFTNRMNMVQVFIANDHFEAAKKELDKTSNPEFLTKEEKMIWQKNYLAWGLHSPEGQRRLINNWKEFLKKYPNYKIGWIYLGYFQTLYGKEQEAQESFQKAKEIDPGLEKEIEKILNSKY